jgi:hypothetical protein
MGETARFGGFFQKFISRQNSSKVFGGMIKICSESTFVGWRQKSGLYSQKLRATFFESYF